MVSFQVISSLCWFWRLWTSATRSTLCWWISQSPIPCSWCRTCTTRVTWTRSRTARPIGTSVFFLISSTRWSIWLWPRASTWSWLWQQTDSTLFASPWPTGKTISPCRLRMRNFSAWKKTQYSPWADKHWRHQVLENVIRKNELTACEITIEASLQTRVSLYFLQVDLLCFHYTVVIATSFEARSRLRCRT